MLGQGGFFVRGYQPSAFSFEYFVFVLQRFCARDAGIEADDLLTANRSLPMYSNEPLTANRTHAIAIAIRLPLTELGCRLDFFMHAARACRVLAIS
jgi:hypothetical protein